VWGDAYVPSGKTLRVRGNLKLRPGACLDAFTPGIVHVRGNIRVQRGALLGLGCTPNAIGPGPPCNDMSTNDTVRGNIIAKNPPTMYLDGNTVWGDVISQGGGLGLHGDFLNYVFKDNWVGGDLIVRGWRGGWAGAIRNTVGGNLVWTKNKSAVDPDSNEVATSSVSAPDSEETRRGAAGLPAWLP